jgi:prophage tail gpP-like protein
MKENIITILIDDVEIKLKNGEPDEKASKTPNPKSFDLFFKEASISRSMDDISGVLRIITKNPIVSKQDNSFPIREGAKFQAFVNGTSVMAGYIDAVEVQYASNLHQIVISARDKTADIIDSEIENGSFSVEEPITLKNLIELAIKKLNITDIKVIDNVGDKEGVTLTDAGEDAAVSVHKYLNRYAILRKSLLMTDGKGNIVIDRASTKDSGAILINSVEKGNSSNIIEGYGKFDSSQRFYKYVVHSQENIAFTVAEQEKFQQGANTNAAAFDNRIRKSRIKTIVAENASGPDGCVQRAIWEKNLRMAQARIVSYSVKGFEYADKKIWFPNQLVQIDDDFCDVHAKMVVKELEFTQYGGAGGSKTRLTFVSPEAYSAQLEVSKIEEEAKALGGRFSVNDLLRGNSGEEEFDEED